jgi:hypothetical protein
MVNQRVNAAGTALPVQTPTPIKDNAPGQLEARIATLEALLAKQLGTSAPPANPIHQASANAAAIAEELLNDYEPSFSEQEDFNDEEVDPFDV